MIYELLSIGIENALTARELSGLVRINPRQVTRQIEKERRAGKPICANCCGDGPLGYYIPETDEELEQYCRQLKHRGIEILKTCRGMQKPLKIKRKSHN